MSNTLGLPQVVAFGIWNYCIRSSRDVLPEPQAIYDQGYFPALITTQAGSDSVSTAITWATFVTVAQSAVNCPISITHPNGLVERMEYAGTPIKKISDYAFNPDTGEWVGFHPSSEYAFFSKQYLPVSRITRDGGSTGQTIVISRITPDWSEDAREGGTQWYETKHITSISFYPNADATGKCRTTRLVHQSYPVATSEKRNIGVPGSADASEMQSAYLFATSTVLRAECYDENGSIYRAIHYDGWNLRSFVNPNGVVAVDGKAVTVPITAAPNYVRIEEPMRPPRVQLAQTWDNFGYKDVHLGAEVPAGSSGWSASDGLVVGTWGDPFQPASAVSTLTSTTRIWSANYTLVPVKVEKTLSGANLGELRENSAAGVALETTEYTYDSLGRPVHIVTNLGSNEKGEVRTYSGKNPNPDETAQEVITGYTTTIQDDQIISIPEYLDFSGQAGKVFTYGSGPNYFLLSEMDRLTGALTTYERDALGRVTRMTDPNGVVTTTTYDAWGRAYQVVRQAIGGVGQTTETHTYDPAGRWTQVVLAAEGRTLSTRTDLDAFDRTVGERAMNGGVRTTTYNGYGEMLTQSPWLRPGQAAYGNFTHAYDAKGRLIETKDPKGRVVSSAPDEPAWDATAKGVKASTLDDRGLTKSVVTDLLAQTRQVTDEKGQTASYAYDALGHMIRMEMGGQARSYTYNTLGFLTSRNEPEEGITTYDLFTVWGTPARTTRWRPPSSDPSVIDVGEPVVTTFDAKGRPSVIGHMTDDPTFTRTITYDDAFPDRVTSIQEDQSFGWVKESYAYDGLGRMIQKTVQDDQEQTFVVSRALDSLGNLTSLTYPEVGGAPGKTLQVSYDSYARPQAVSFNGNARAVMTYDQVSGSSVSTSLALANGATTLQTQTQGELARVLHSAGGSVVEDSALTWTAGGLLLSRGADVFHYDELGRLSDAQVQGLGSIVTTQQFEYDAFGNRTKSASATVNGDNPQEALSWEAAYGLDNRLPVKIKGIAGEMLTGAEYGDFGRLSQVWTIPGKSDTAVTWQYDALGRVIQQNSTAFLLDAQGLRFRRISSDGMVNYTVYGFDRDPLATFEAQVPVGTQSSLMTASATTAVALKSVAAVKASASAVATPAAETAQVPAPAVLRRTLAKPSGPVRYVRRLGSPSGNLRVGVSPKSRSRAVTR